MILRKLSEVAGASDADLRESLNWWQEGKLFLGRAAETGPQHQRAMVVAILTELERHTSTTGDA